jgi:histidine phosphotransferase ChpT
MTEADLHELIGARLCHDLISPVSAIGNGLELVMATPTPAPEDLELLQQSADAARGALAFNRLAFGTRGTDDTLIGHRTVVDLVMGHLGEGRLRFDLGESGPDLPRPVAKMLLLAILAAAGMAPLGGMLTLAPITVSPPAIALTLTGRKVTLPEGARPMLEEGLVPPTLQPREVHYVLLNRLATALGAAVMVETAAAAREGEATLRLAIG